jgi:biopolymer transport protein ExbD
MTTMREAVMPRAVPEINTTPLIDVLLVLLILLIVTLPRTTHRITLDLPSGPPRAQAPVPVTDVEIDFDGQVFWNGSPVSDDGLLAQRFGAAATTPGIVRIEADRHVRYERVAQVLASAQRAHVTHLALVPVTN